ncbi:PIN domain-containing protein [Micromonospora sp. URMC 106]|uniref:PIN domain-containing protein n=1 Tax=Micromonospora sp. URMC 106 TaxID=3423408 RepID=UPI003F1A6B8B
MSTEIIDTQIISYAFKGVPDYTVTSKAISSVTAQEFLLVQANDFKRARYYLPRLTDWEVAGIYERLKSGDTEAKLRFGHQHRGWKRRTDQLIIELNSDFPAIIEYGHNRISVAINNQDRRYYELCVNGLDRKLQRKLLSRFDFIIENRVSCLSLSPVIVERMFVLLEAFSTKFNAKSNYRNTINDMLILATALEREAQLLTNDTLLNRFAANFFDAPFTPQSNDTCRIDFSKKSQDRRKPLESKGYINRSWQVHERRGRS